MEMLSFIIPAYNEEKNISKTLDMIRKYLPLQLNYEVILIDHASKDKTGKIAKEMGARVFIRNGGTVAGLRNYGAQNAHGDIFIFLDADVLITKKWSENIENIIVNLRSGERKLTGSWVSIPDNASWIEKNWFEPLQKLDNTHINSGHMIVSREIFNELSGFDEKLESGEDYDFSMRAKTRGIQIIDEHNLKVVHQGYPKRLWDFVLREYWHGKGDAVSLMAIVKSKVALIALVFIALHIIILASLFSPTNINLIFACVCLISFICLVSSYVKYKNETLNVITINSILYYFYFFSRAVSLLNLFIKSSNKKRQR